MRQVLYLFVCILCAAVPSDAEDRGPSPPASVDVYSSSNGGAIEASPAIGQQPQVRTGYFVVAGIGLLLMWGSWRDYFWIQWVAATWAMVPGRRSLRARPPEKKLPNQREWSRLMNRLACFLVGATLLLWAGGSLLGVWGPLSPTLVDR